MSMPVVVGTSYRKTPVFSARMTYLEFAPHWTVPSTILREDKLPLIKKNPGWLARHHYEIVPWSGAAKETIDLAAIDWKTVEADTFPGTLRMKPGPWNPLGRIKFMFPNRFAVYLHDTPDRYLFTRDIRSYSSGCIRVERPLDLAQFLLEKAAEWDCDLILDALESDEPLTVSLPAVWPVHILYWTAWVDAEGALQFRDDFYLRDLDLELALIRASEGTKAEAGTLITAGS
jgi:murein L,D-transpeptidase YcbB/YkuD